MRVSEVKKLGRVVIIAIVITTVDLSLLLPQLEYVRPDSTKDRRLVQQPRLLGSPAHRLAARNSRSQNKQGAKVRKRAASKNLLLVANSRRAERQPCGLSSRKTHAKSLSKALCSAFPGAIGEEGVEGERSPRRTRTNCNAAASLTAGMQFFCHSRRMHPSVAAISPFFILCVCAPTGAFLLARMLFLWFSCDGNGSFSHSFSPSCGIFPFYFLFPVVKTVRLADGQQKEKFTAPISRLQCNTRKQRDMARMVGVLGCWLLLIVLVVAATSAQDFHGATWEQKSSQGSPLVTFFASLSQLVASFVLTGPTGEQTRQTGHAVESHGG